MSVTLICLSTDQPHSGFGIGATFCIDRRMDQFLVLMTITHSGSVESAVNRREFKIASTSPYKVFQR